MTSKKSMEKAPDLRAASERALAEMQVLIFVAAMHYNGESNIIIQDAEEAYTGLEQALASLTQEGGAK